MLPPHAGSGTLLKARRETVLQPYGYAGMEEHYIPLSQAFVVMVHAEARTLTVKLPKGVEPGKMDMFQRRKLDAYRFMSRFLLSLWLCSLSVQLDNEALLKIRNFLR